MCCLPGAQFLFPSWQMTFSEDHHVSGGISLNASVFPPVSLPAQVPTTLGEPQFAPSFLDAEWEVSSCGPVFPVPSFKAKNDSQKKKKKKDCPGSVPFRCQPEVKSMHPFLGAISNPKSRDGATPEAPEEKKSWYRASWWSSRVEVKTLVLASQGDAGREDNASSLPGSPLHEVVPVVGRGVRPRRHGIVAPLWAGQVPGARVRVARAARRRHGGVGPCAAHGRARRLEVLGRLEGLGLEAKVEALVDLELRVARGLQRAEAGVVAGHPLEGPCAAEFMMASPLRQRRGRGRCGGWVQAEGVPLYSGGRRGAGDICPAGGRTRDFGFYRRSGGRAALAALSDVVVRDMGYLQGWLLSMGIGGLETPVTPEAAENTRCEVVGFVCRAEHLGCLVAGGRRKKGQDPTPRGLSL